MRSTTSLGTAPSDPARPREEPAGPVVAAPTIGPPGACDAASGARQPAVPSVLDGKRALSGRHVALLALLVVVLCVAGALLGVLGPSSRSKRATEPPRTVLAGGSGKGAAVTGPAAFMGLVALGARPAPTLSLVDQYGARVSLARLRGKVVVLTFLDDLCGSLCPVLPEELQGAFTDLGSAARSVAFVAVNVDPAHRAPADLRAYSSTYRLSRIGSWYFLTGSVAQLAAAWKAYGISVGPGPAGTMAYTSTLYFVSAGGEEAYEATPYANQLANGTGTLPAPEVKAWAAGIAGYAERLLPHGRAK